MVTARTPSPTFKSSNSICNGHSQRKKRSQFPKKLLVPYDGDLRISSTPRIKQAE